MRAVNPNLWKEEIECGWDSKRNVPVKCKAIDPEKLLAALEQQGFTPREAKDIQCWCEVFGLTVMPGTDGRPRFCQTWEYRSRVNEQEKPQWNKERRELWYHGRIIKRLKRKAENQCTILDTFEDSWWEDRIDDPLSDPPLLSAKSQNKDVREAEQRARAVARKERLQQTIEDLHKGLKGGIRFHGDGTGEGIFWKAIEEQPETGEKTRGGKAKTTTAKTSKAKTDVVLVEAKTPKAAKPTRKAKSSKSKR